MILFNSTLTEQTVLPTDQFFSIVQGLVERNEQSLADLYDCTLAKVYGLALKITRRHDLAEEIVEDTYMQAWQEISKFDSARGPVMAWLMVICRSRAIDALRRLDLAELHAEPESLITELGKVGSPLDILLLLERESTIQITMAQLNALERQLLALAFFKGFTHDEIASQMKMPLGTVKSTIKRAQDKLKIALTKTEGE